MLDLVRYRWRVRMEGTGKVYTTPSRMTDEQARAKYGARLVERIEASGRVTTGDNEEVGPTSGAVS